MLCRAGAWRAEAARGRKILFGGESASPRASDNCTRTFPRGRSGGQWPPATQGREHRGESKGGRRRGTCAAVAAAASCARQARLSHWWIAGASDGGWWRRGSTPMIPPRTKQNSLGTFQITPNNNNLLPECAWDECTGGGAVAVVQVRKRNGEFHLGGGRGWHSIHCPVTD